MTELSTEHQIVVGIVGGAASGKDTVAGLFVEKGYYHISSSDLVRQEITHRGLTTSRPLQTTVANELRAEHGPGYWVDLSMARIGRDTPKAVVSGLYAPAEGEHLIEHYGGSLVGVVAGEGDDRELRYHRLASRANGPRDGLSRDEFMAAHARENGGVLVHETNVSKLLHLAHYMVYNTADFAHLTEQTKDIIEQIEGGHSI